MKSLKVRLSALAMLIILLVVTVLPSFAATQPAKYSSTYNSGERDVVCTTLDGTTAAGYYTGSNTYDNLSAQSASALLQSLRTLMTSTHTKQSSYDDCHYKADKTDCENEDGKVSLIYTSYSATMSQYNGWNREHVWPKSLGGFETSGAGADLHHIRPSDAVVNSARGNDKYGNVNGGKEVKGSNPATGYVGGYSGGGYFEPLDNVKGDVARICLYVYVRWGATYSKSNNINNVFQSVDVLLEWCELDPVDTWEMGRNEVVYAIQGNRNVFIDYPEYAWLLFGRSVPSDMTTPSGKASGGNAGGGNQGGNVGGGDQGDDEPPVVVPPAEDEPFVDETPDVGTAYKFGMVQENLGDTYYLVGGMDGYYMATTTDYDSALDVYLEATAGGYYLYTKSGSTKQYVNMVVSADGQHVNGAYETTAKTVYTIDPTLKSVVATVDGAVYHFGTRNDKSYDTIGPCKTSYGGFNCQFYTTDESSECAHATTEKRGVEGATCGKSGYTGDTYCSECDEKLSTGTAIPATGDHDFGDWEKDASGSLLTRTCGVCSKTESKPAQNPATCPHASTYLKGAVDATCTEFGYSGDECCKDCEALIAKGTKLPYADHDYGEPELITEPTDGGDGLARLVCSSCGAEKQIKWNPTVAPKTDTTRIVVVVTAASVGGVSVLAILFFVLKRRLF